MCLSGIGWPPRENFIAGKHGRGDIATLMHFRDHNGDDVENDEDYQRVKGNFMHRHKGPAERAHGCIGRFVDQLSVSKLNRCRIDTGSSNSLCEPMTEWRPEQIGSGNYETSR